MSKKTVVCLAIILSFLHVLYEVILGLSELKKEIPEGKACDKLKNEKCSVYLWNMLIFRKHSCCAREQCPGFILYENGIPQKKISILSVIGIIIKHAPALSALLLLFLYIIE